MTPLDRSQLQGLLRRLSDGDRSAVEPAFTALWPVVRDFAARIVPAADAEDAAQLALTKLFEDAARFDPARDGVAWILTIVRFECRTLLRRAQRRSERPSDVELLAGAPVESPIDILMRRDLHGAVREVLAGLPEQDVTVILADLDSERPTADAAFRKRLQRARERLRTAWRKSYGTED